MAESLSTYEMSLSAPRLYAYIEQEAQQQWRITKSASTRYDPVRGLEELFRRKPALYQRYQAQVLKHEDADEPAPAFSPMRHPLRTEEAREDLEALAKSYLSDGLAPTYEEGLALAIRHRPDLYTAFTRSVPRDTEPGSPSRPGAAVGPGRADGGQALATLDALAHDYIAKGLVDSYPAGLERAIRERPDLYEAHAEGVRVQKVVR